MSLLAQLHSYAEGGLLNSDHWDAELDQLINVIKGSNNVNRVIISGQSDGANDPILSTKSNGGGVLLKVMGLIVDSRILNTGVLRNLGDSVSVEFVVSSSIKCPNLNAEYLNGVLATQLQQKQYSVSAYGVFYPANTASTDPDKAAWISGVGGGLVTKLKAQQQGVASADASTIITFLRNGVSIGTVTISGNTTAVQTNDIADVAFLSEDILSVSVTTYAGTTKHTDITASFHIKNKFVL